MTQIEEQQARIAELKDNERTKDFILTRLQEIEKIDTWDKRLHNLPDGHIITDMDVQSAMIGDSYDLRMAINNLIADIKKGEEG